jgi:hypothetical protein
MLAAVSLVLTALAVPPTTTSRGESFKELTSVSLARLALAVSAMIEGVVAAVSKKCRK